MVALPFAAWTSCPCPFPSSWPHCWQMASMCLVWTFFCAPGASAAGSTVARRCTAGHRRAGLPSWTGTSAWGHAHQGVEDGRQLPGGGARRQAAVTCKDRNDISGLELKHGKHEQANINACTFNRMGEDKWRNGCRSFWKLNLWWNGAAAYGITFHE